MDQKFLQEKFIVMQKAINETVFSINNDMQASFNGQVEITELKVDSINEEDKVQLIEMLNRGIKQVSQKIQQAMIQIQKEMMMGG